MTVFALFMFTVLLVQVVNVGRRVDDKIRMQNAADAGAYSGGVVIARGMNTLAFTNHLEAEVFALTAYMRTAQMKDEETGELVVQSLTKDILDKWEEIGKVFEEHGGSAGYIKFRLLGTAIQQKVPLERDVVTAFSEMSARHAELTQPVLEYILHAGEGGNSGGGFGSPASVPDGGIIPRFQRVVVQSIPRVANLTANELAERYGRPGERLRRNGRRLQGRMWRTDAVAVVDADESDPLTRTMPAIDPSPTGVDGPPSQTYYTIARQQRKKWAKHYLEMWIRDWMGPYFSYSYGVSFRYHRPGRSTAKMSQLINLWRTFACGHLDYLLDVEYPDTNLPHVIRSAAGNVSSNQSLERDHQFLSVAYWPHLRETFPGLYRNPLHRDGSDAMTFAQVQVFLPRNRFICCPWSYPVVNQQTGEVHYPPRYESMPRHWDLMNQNWQCKLVAATSRSVPRILQQAPSDLPNFRPPRFTGVSEADFQQLNHH